METLQMWIVDGSPGMTDDRENLLVSYYESEEAAWARAACDAGDATRPVPQPLVNGLRCGTWREFASGAVRYSLDNVTSECTYARLIGRDVLVLLALYVCGLAVIPRIANALCWLLMLWLVTFATVIPITQRMIWMLSAWRAHAAARKRCWRAAQIMSLARGAAKNDAMLAWLEARVGPPLPLGAQREPRGLP